MKKLKYLYAMLRYNEMEFHVDWRDWNFVFIREYYDGYHTGFHIGPFFFYMTPL